MSNAAYQEETTSTLSYFLWLPAGKDEFGFANLDNAPLNPTAAYRDNIERTISGHLAEQARRMQTAGQLAGMRRAGSLAAVDAELGLRKIQYQFDYHPVGTELNQVAPAGPIRGTATILSNGLYLWTFYLRHWVDVPEEALRDAATAFLKEDFVVGHVARLFHFEWKTGTHDRSATDAGGTPDRKILASYDGILTYYQLDLLFNGILDIGAHPHRALIQSPPGGLPGVYSVQSVIESLSLASFQNRYFPLYDERKDFSLRGSHADAEQNYIGSNVNLAATSVPADSVAAEAETKADRHRELFLSRVSFAGMEQFLRVAVSYGLTHYRNGLDHCRAELVNQSLLARRNRMSAELRRPSLSAAPLSLADLEAYHTVVAGKLPLLVFLSHLVEGLSEVSSPLNPPRELKDEWVEWAYSRSTLAEAMTQFDRQIETIKADVIAIDGSLATARSDLMLAELTEARKLTEIEAETPRAAVVLESGEWDALTVRLAEIALLLGALEIVSNVGVWSMDRLLGTQSFADIGLMRWLQLAGVWVLPLFPLVLWWYLWQRRKRKSRSGQGDGDRNGDQVHVFDYSSLRRPIDAQEKSEGVVKALRKTMLDLETLKPGPGCASYSTFRETPSNGVERVKHSLRSVKTAGGAWYVLHIEVESQIGDRNIEQLRDVRLVATMPQGHKLDVMPNSIQVIGDCVKSLILNQKEPEEARAFLRERFGWDWNPQPSA
jgi:hypothetical protein